MRVLSVGNRFPPHHLGGLELSWQSVVRDLRRRGDDVRVLTSSVRGDAASSVPDDDPDVYRSLTLYGMGERPASLGARARVRIERHNRAELRRHLDAFAPDLVHWWGMGGLSLSMLAFVRDSGLPAVAMVNDEWPIYGPTVDQWHRVWRTRPRLAGVARAVLGTPPESALDAPTTWVFNSHHTRARMRDEAGLEPEHWHVIPPGCAPVFYRPRDDGSRPWAWRLVYAGRMERRKGVDVAVRALAALPPETDLQLVGTTDYNAAYVAELRTLARDLGVEDRVSLRPPVDPEELAAIFASADALVFPVRWSEPWGRAPLEAMASRLPVVATGTGGGAEYMREGENCLIVAIDDPGDLAAKLRRLADDDGLRERLRAGGVRTAERHTAEAYTAQVGSVLRETVVTGR